MKIQVKDIPESVLTQVYATVESQVPKRWFRNEVENYLISKFETQDLYVWVEKLHKTYKNPKVADELFSILPPLLPRKMEWLNQHMISSALAMFERDGKNKFKVFGPLFSDSEVSETMIRNSGAKRFCFFFVHGATEKQLKTQNNLFLGYHWSAVYLDTEPLDGDGKPDLNFFDSAGSNPGKSDLRLSIIKLYNTLLQVFPKIPSHITYCSLNKLPDGKSCGVLLVHFIALRLNGMGFRTWKELSFTPEDIHVLRNTYWNETETLDDEWDMIQKSNS